MDIEGSGSITVNNKTISWILPTNVKATLNTTNGTVKVKEDSSNTYKKGDLMNRYVTGDLTVKIPVGATAPTGAIFTCLYI